MSAQAGAEPEGQLAIRTIAMPADTNPNGDIFGGWLLAQMDLAGGNVAMARSRGRCATVAVDGMAFLSPVYVGDEVSIHARVLSVGRTSMRLGIEAWRRNRHTDARIKVTEAAARRSTGVMAALTPRRPPRRAWARRRATSACGAARSAPCR